MMNENSNNSDKQQLTASGSDGLFDRVVTILDRAKTQAVYSVNSAMVIAYWLIGREIVQAIQGGDERAEYGKQIIKDLSARLNKIYGKGFSTSTLWYFRQFYVVYSNREPRILHKACGESDSAEKLHKHCGVLDDLSLAIEKRDSIQGFSPALSWSHYRTLSKVKNKNERLFYEIESEKEGWSVPVLERQIHSFLFARLLKSRDKSGVLKLATEGQAVKNPADTIKDPYIQYEDEFFYIDLVFYNCILKCYLLIDLKIGKLVHQDVGQMDSYVRMFDELFIAMDDNPTIGLILCSEKNEAIARYSVLNNSKQLFASKYVLYLPTEEELERELERERRLIEETARRK